MMVTVYKLKKLSIKNLFSIQGKDLNPKEIITKVFEIFTRVRGEKNVILH